MSPGIRSCPQTGLSKSSVTLSPHFLSRLSLWAASIILTGTLRLLVSEKISFLRTKCSSASVIPYCSNHLFIRMYICEDITINNQLKLGVLQLFLYLSGAFCHPVLPGHHYFWTGVCVRKSKCVFVSLPVMSGRKKINHLENHLFLLSDSKCFSCWIKIQK